MRKFTKTFTTATAVACLLAGGLNVQAKDTSYYKDCFISKDVHMVKDDDGTIHVINNNKTDLFEMKSVSKDMYVDCDYLNLRKTPTTKYKPLMTKHIGEKVHVVGESKETGWSVVSLETDCEQESDICFAYVRSKYLTEECPITPMGSFKISFYCNCDECSEGWGTLTSTGHETVEGLTVAVDPDVIPLGTEIYIDGYGTYLADDVGGAVEGNHLDIYVNHHDITEDLGIDYKDVYIINGDY